MLFMLSVTTMLGSLFIFGQLASVKGAGCYLVWMALVKVLTGYCSREHLVFRDVSLSVSSRMVLLLII